MTFSNEARAKSPAPRSPVLEALGAAWVIFKSVLSLGLVSVATWLIWNSEDRLHLPGSLGIAACLLVLAALPWLAGKRTYRGVGLLSVFMSIMFAFAAGSIVTGGLRPPPVCAGRSAAICEISKGLQALGGPWLSALPVILIAAVLLGGGILVVVRGDRPVRPGR